ncbi:M28 family metallopeptidase [Halpernia frigidisoli]|uniref:Aminopeptidase YwaD n=1 Tax=Halpernia frigidisoli TaxID=1125876 RepID=A0A1I3CV71_9FLAO|nr:M28 family metallopeptidase [Halpernia frigidisoli]SFH78405.1 aminopeptidase YwaD [Halpernia frigidisoli]
MKKILYPSLLALSVMGFSQTFTQEYKNRADLVLQTNLQTYNADLVSKGIRHLGSTASYTNYYSNNKAALDYIVAKLKTFGYTDADMVIQNVGTTAKPILNLILTKIGVDAQKKNTFVIMGGHFDSVAAGVGANDNLSGVAAILETARILKNVNTNYTVKFIFFNAEESGTYNGVSGGLFGSTQYANSLPNGTSIKVMFNLDMVGGNTSLTNNSITCEADKYNNVTTGTQSSNDAESLVMTTQLKNCVPLYSNLTGLFSNAYSSDYMPFENKGFVITGFYERMTDASGGVIEPNPTYHKSTDIAANVSYPYLVQTTKAALGAMQHFSEADTNSAVLATTEAKDFNNFKIYPNPAKEVINITVPNTDKYEITLIEPSGKVLIKDNNKKQINTSKLKNGIYYVILKTSKQSVFETVVIQK